MTKEHVPHADWCNSLVLGTQIRPVGRCDCGASDQRLRTPQGEPALTPPQVLPGTREPVVTAPQGNAGESPAHLPTSKQRIATADLEACRSWLLARGDSLARSRDMILMVDELLERRANETDSYGCTGCRSMPCICSQLSKTACEHPALTKCDDEGEGVFYWICTEPGCDFKTPEFNPDSSTWLSDETTGRENAQRINDNGAREIERLDDLLDEARDVIRTLLRGEKVNVDRMEALLGSDSSVETDGERRVAWCNVPMCTRDQEPSGSGYCAQHQPLSRELQLETALGQWLHDFGSTNELSQRTRILLGLSHATSPSKASEQSEPAAKVCQYTQAEGDTLLYLTTCGREFWREGTKELYEFCRWCGGAVEEISSQNGKGES